MTGCCHTHARTHARPDLAPRAAASFKAPSGAPRAHTRARTHVHWTSNLDAWSARKHSPLRRRRGRGRTAVRGSTLSRSVRTVHRAPRTRRGFWGLGYTLTALRLGARFRYHIEGCVRPPRRGQGFRDVRQVRYRAGEQGAARQPPPLRHPGGPRARGCRGCDSDPGRTISRACQVRSPPAVICEGQKHPTANQRKPAQTGALQAGSHTICLADIITIQKGTTLPAAARRPMHTGVSCSSLFSHCTASFTLSLQGGEQYAE